MTEPFKVNVTMDFEAPDEADIAEMFKDVCDMLNQGVSSGNGTLPDGRGSYTFTAKQNKRSANKSLAEQGMKIAMWWHSLDQEQQRHWQLVADSDDVTEMWAAYKANHPDA